MELLDLVDENDTVVGVTDRLTAHTSRLPHRVIAVFVFNKKGGLYVQAHKKSGGRYDHSVGGHVVRGETYADAAMREAKEELGIVQPLIELSRFTSDEGSFLHMFGLFECAVAEEWVFTPNEEVEEVFLMKIEDIRAMMRKYPEKFVTGFINSMTEYCRVKGYTE
jgi:isopentenyldiphosphate isomerase